MTSQQKPSLRVLPFNFTFQQAAAALVNTEKDPYRWFRKAPQGTTSLEIAPVNNPLQSILVPFMDAQVLVPSYPVSYFYEIDRQVDNSYWSWRDGKPHYVHSTYTVTDRFDGGSFTLPACLYPFGSSWTRSYCGYAFPREEIESVFEELSYDDINLVSYTIEEAESAGGVVVQAHTENGAVTKERIISNITRSETSRATTAARKQQSCDRVVLTGHSIDLNEPHNFLLRPVHFPVYVLRSKTTTYETRRYVCGRRGLVTGLSPLSSGRVGGASGMVTFLSFLGIRQFLIVRAIGIGVPIASLGLYSVPDLAMFSIGLGVLLSISTTLWPYLRERRLQRKLYKEAQYNRSANPTRKDRQRAALGTPDVSVERDQADEKEAVDPGLDAALIVLEFDPKLVRQTNLSLQEIMDRRASLLHKCHPDKWDLADVVTQQAAAQRTQAIEDAYRFLRSYF